MSGVKITLEPADFLRRVREVAALQNFSIEPFATIGGIELFALIRRTGPEHPNIYLSTGIHGDEPAGPNALLQLLSAGEFDERANWYLVPMINPGGFLANRRENALGADLNRDFKEPKQAEIIGLVSWLEKQAPFLAAWCLHEDWEAKGFYLYELNPDAKPSLATTMLAAVEAHLPIERADIIDGHPANAPGIIHPSGDPLLRELWPEAIYLQRHHPTLGYTLETPSGFALDKRITAQTAAVHAALAKLLG